MVLKQERYRRELSRYVEANKLMTENARLENKLVERMAAHASGEKDLLDLEAPQPVSQSDSEDKDEKRKLHLAASQRAMLLAQSIELRDLRSKLMAAEVRGMGLSRVLGPDS